MASARDRNPRYTWTSDQKAEFKKLSGSFQVTPYAYDQEASAACPAARPAARPSTPPAARRFVRPRAYSPSDRNSPCHVFGPSPPFSAIVASHGRRFGTLLYRGPPVPVAVVPAPTTSATTRRSKPYVSGAYAATTAPDRDFFTRGPPEFPPGHNHYQVSDEFRKAWCTAGSSTDQAQKK
ncbi:hypothetical protein MMC15_001419 [Xylographa vitiligo]|nr:hypothetical protein [Xylographa vitiligo]